MSVQNGQNVSAEVTNAAFMSRTENTDTVGSVGLLKPTGSGSLILDAQKTISNIIAATGMAYQDATTIDFTSTTYVSDGTIKDAIEDLDAAIVSDSGALSSHISDASTHGTTGNIVGTTDTQVLTNKDIDGGTASNSNRITLPKAAKTTLDALTRKEGTVVYATDEDKVYYDDGTTLKPVGSGSGGGVNFIDNGDAESGTTGWTTYNSVLTASAFASTDAASVTIPHNIPSGVYDIKVKILSVSTPCGLTVGDTYYAVYSSPTFLIFTNTPAGPAVDITADATITFAEIRPRVPVGIADITWTTSSTNPLIGANSFLLTKDAVNRQYQGVMYDFSIDKAYQAKVLKIEMDYIVESGTFAAGSSTTDSDLIVYLYDVTNGVLIEPSSFKLLSNSTTVSDRFSGTFQTPYNSTSYRLIFHVASVSTSAWTLKVDNISVSPSQYVYGTPITDWQSYTPTLSWVANVSSNGAFWRRVGDSLEVQGNLTLSGTPTAADLSISIPSGLTINTSKLNGGISNKDSFGTASIIDSGNRFYIAEIISGTTTSVIVTHTESGNFGTVNATNPVTFGASDAVGYRFSVPILGWSSSVQVSDGYDGRQVLFESNELAFSATGGGAVIQVTGLTSLIDTVASFSSNAYTIRTSGRYRVSGYSGTGSNGTTKYLQVKKNGNALLNIDGAVNSYTTISGSKVFDFVAGDVITLWFSNAGATETWGLRSFSIEKLPGSATISATETVSALYTGAPPTGTLSATYNIVTYGTKVEDTHGAYSGGVYTIQQSGSYDIAAQFYVNYTSVGAGTTTAVSIFIDGVERYSNIVTGETTALVPAIPQVVVFSIPLIAGQQVSIRSFANGTGPSFLNSAAHNRFSIALRK